MPHKTKDSSTLSISSSGISDCRDVAEYMRMCRIPCHVTTNDTVLPSEGSGVYDIERGCQIKFGSHAATLLTPTFWTSLKSRFALSCAHLEVEGKFKGCVYDFFRQSACPMPAGAILAEEAGDTQ